MMPHCPLQNNRFAGPPGRIRAWTFRNPAPDDAGVVSREIQQETERVSESDFSMRSVVLAGNYSISLLVVSRSGFERIKPLVKSALLSSITREINLYWGFHSIAEMTLFDLPQEWAKQLSALCQCLRRHLQAMRGADAPGPFMMRLRMIFQTCRPTRCMPAPPLTKSNPLSIISPPDITCP